MKSHSTVPLLLLVAFFVSPSAGEVHSPDYVVRNLYQQIILRKPLGIPKGADKAAIWPFLSKRLINELDAAQSCEDDYFRLHTDKHEKPVFAWLEMDLFSGANEEAIPSAAVVDRTAPQKYGAFRVFVRLTYRETYETYGKPPDPANTFDWQIAAVVISEDGQFRVDDVLFFNDNSTKIESRLTDLFHECHGSRWVGEKQ
jgi:hypothetical protein